MIKTRFNFLSLNQCNMKNKQYKGTLDHFTEILGF
jgi:hypothetical protein